MNIHTYDSPGSPLGETLAIEIQTAIQGYGLDDVLVASYASDCHSLRLVWRGTDRTLDFPATIEWVERLRSALPTYAERRQAFLN